MLNSRCYFSNSEIAFIILIVLTDTNSVYIQTALLSEERETLTLQLQTTKCQLIDVMEMLEGLERAKGMFLFFCPKVCVLTFQSIFKLYAQHVWLKGLYLHLVFSLVL